MKSNILIILCFAASLIWMVCGVYFPLTFLWFVIGLHWNWLANIAILIISVTLVALVLTSLYKEGSK